MQAIQILLAISQQSREATAVLLADKEGDFRKAFDLLKDAFNSARRIYSQTSSLLTAKDVDVGGFEDGEVFRISNLASISASAFEGERELLNDAHDNFNAVFIADDGELTDDMIPIYLNLKTQAFINSLKEADDIGGRTEILNKYFQPPSTEDTNKMVHDGSVESALASEIETRRELFLKSSEDDNERSE
jgi:hypothetical protein